MNNFLDTAKGIGSFFWLLALIWIGYFFLCRSLDYPSELEKHIRKGKVWPYLPIFWKGKRKRLIRAGSVALFWLGNILCACAFYYWFPKHWILLFIGLCASFFAEMKIRQRGVNEVIHLQKDRYFQIYSRMENQALSKGNEISDSELQSKAQWQQQNDLRLADKQGRLIAFLKGEAKL